MKKSKIFIPARYLVVAILVFCVLSFAGCGTKGATDKVSFGNEGTASETENNNSSAGDFPESNNEKVNDNKNQEDNAFSLLENSTVQGSVVEFSDEYCTITPVEFSDDNEAIVAAPGSEDPDKNITIHYQNDCTFQIAEIDVGPGTKTFSDAEISDIKKQTSLIIYGEWTDARNINATKVFITRYKQ